MSLGLITTAIGPLITFIFSITLAVYIYILHHDHLANRIFIVFMIAIAFLTLFDFIQAFINAENIALIVSRSKYALLLFIPAIFLHLTIALSDDRKIYASKKFTIIPYIICIMFAVLTISTNLFVAGVKYMGNIYETQDGVLYPIIWLVLFIFLISGMVVLILTFKGTRNGEKRLQLKYIFYGMIITSIIVLIVTFIIPLFMGIKIKGTVLSSLPMFIFFAYAIAKHKLMNLPKLVREKDIMVEPIDYDLEPGYTYIIPEQEPNLGFQLFAKSLKEGAHGILITMRDPKEIRLQFGLKKTPIIWITDKDVQEFSVKPEQISFINEILKPFFDRSEDSVIFLIDDKTITSGVKQDGHSKVLELSKNFFDGIVTSNSKFIISVSPGSISPKKRLPIIKTKTPLLEFTRLAGFVFEEICNNIIQFLIRNGYIKQESIPMHLFNLSKKDKFFRTLKYRRSHNPVTTDNKIKFSNILVAQRLSKQILIDKVKLFIGEFENIETATNLNSIAIKIITEYGLSKNEFLLHPGDSYLIPEHEPYKSFEIFSEFTSKEFKGLCITKSNPKKIKRKYGLIRLGTKVFWLTDISDSNQDIIPPKLEHIHSAIEEFLAKNHNKKIIMLDGIEFLITYSGDNFDPVLSFLRRVVDLVSETNAIFITPINPAIINGERMGLMIRSGFEVMY